MFGKFGGIAIIALSGAIIAGLILRPTPDLPPAMTLGTGEQAAPANTGVAAGESKTEEVAETTAPVADTVTPTAEPEVAPEEKTTNTTESTEATPEEVTPPESQEVSTEEEAGAEKEVAAEPVENNEKTE